MRPQITRLTSLLVVLLALLSASQASGVSAGANIWIGIGPGGGNVNAVAIDPQTPGTVYAGTWGSGVYKSTNGGVSWSATESNRLLCLRRGD